MATLARLHQETEATRSTRRVFMSSLPVQLFKVVHDTKTQLSAEQPLWLERPPTASISLLRAHVGPGLAWDLTAVNHVLRTRSKHGEPTYLFSGVSDTDPTAFIAVTLSKRTPDEELQHLEAVLARVAQFHVAESRPMQAPPSADQLVASLGKGLMKMLLGGGSTSTSSSSTDRHAAAYDQQQRQQQQGAPWESSSGGGYSNAPPAAAWPGPDSRQHKTAEQERAEYLTALSEAHGGGSSSIRGYGEAEDVPTAPVLPHGGGGGGPAVSRREAEARLAALRADLQGPDVAAASGGWDQQQHNRHHATAAAAYPDTPGEPAAAPPAWQQHAPGVLSNPFTSSSSSRPAPPAAPPAGASDMADWDRRLGHAAAATPGTPGATDWKDAAAPPLARQQQEAGGRSSSSRVSYAEGARESWEEWQRVQDQKKAAGARRSDWQQQQEWRRGAAYAGGSSPEQQRRDAAAAQEARLPGWLENLGRVFAAGGGAAAAPDL